MTELPGKSWKYCIAGMLPTSSHHVEPFERYPCGEWPEGRALIENFNSPEEGRSLLQLEAELGDSHES